MDRGLDVRFDREPAVVAGLLEVFDDAALHGILVDVAGDPVSARGIRLRALDVHVHDVIAALRVVVPGRFVVVVVQAVVAGVDDEFEGGARNCFDQLEESFGRFPVTAAILVGEDDALGFGDGGELAETADDLGLPILTGEGSLLVIRPGHDAEILRADRTHPRSDSLEFVDVLLEIRGHGTGPVADLAAEADDLDAVGLELCAHRLPFFLGVVADALSVDETKLDRAPARFLERGDLSIERFFGLVGESGEFEGHGRQELSLNESREGDNTQAGGSGKGAIRKKTLVK